MQAYNGGLAVPAFSQKKLSAFCRLINKGQPSVVWVSLPMGSISYLDNNSTWSYSKHGERKNETTLLSLFYSVPHKGAFC